MANPISYAPGTEASHKGRTCTIQRAVSAGEVLIQYVDTKDIVPVRSSALKARESDAPLPHRTLDAIHDKDLEEARQRLEAIEPLLSLPKRTANDVINRAKELGIGKSTLYRWIKEYKSTKRLTSLAPSRRVKRSKKIDKQVEAIMQDVIENDYLNTQKITIVKTADIIARRCKKAGLKKTPHKNTVRNRINDIDARERTKRRHGEKAARDTYDEITNIYSDLDYPLGCVEIDHTQLDIQIVDDEHRVAIGRPWITLAIDKFSRMITGFHLSLDHPNEFTVGLSIIHSSLEKDAELDRLGIEGKWPVWGNIRTIHTDNGKDLCSKLILKASEEYGINIQRRPVKRPEFGGHVERMMKRLGTEVHTLPGTTFSNTMEKGEYNSIKKAAMTYDELYRWIVDWIVNDYHLTDHRGIEMSPLQKWNEGLEFGSKGRSIGQLPPIQDPEAFKMAFLPFIERTIQREGVAWDNIHYYSPVLKHRIRDKKGRHAAKFIFRRDPRDITKIYFLNPDTGKYEEIRISLRSPAVNTLWELRALKKLKSSLGQKLDHRDQIDRSRDQRDKLVKTAKKDTKKASKKLLLENQKTKNRKKSLQNFPVAPPSPQVVVDNTLGEEEDEKPLNINLDALKKRWKEQSCP